MNHLFNRSNDMERIIKKPEKDTESDITIFLRSCDESKSMIERARRIEELCNTSESKIVEIETEANELQQLLIETSETIQTLETHKVEIDSEIRLLREQLIPIQERIAVFDRTVESKSRAIYSLGLRQGSQQTEINNTQNTVISDVISDNQVIITLLTEARSEKGVTEQSLTKKEADLAIINESLAENEVLLSEVAAKFNKLILVKSELDIQFRQMLQNQLNFIVDTSDLSKNKSEEITKIANEAESEKDNVDVFTVNDSQEQGDNLPSFFEGIQEVPRAKVILRHEGVQVAGKGAKVGGRG